MRLFFYVVSSKCQEGRRTDVLLVVQGRRTDVLHPSCSTAGVPKKSEGSRFGLGIGHRP